MLGKAAVAMWWNVPAEARAEWEDWHSHEHMPERLGIPGFLRGSRWTALSGEPSYFVLYEAESLAVLTSGPYLERLNNPTPWSRRMMPHHHNMVRSLCQVRASFGGGVPRVMATIRVGQGLPAEALAALPKRPGVTSACLLESERMADLPRTTEQHIRGGDAQADWAVLIGGYDPEAVAVAAREAVPIARATPYRLAYCLTAGDLR